MSVQKRGIFLAFEPVFNDAGEYHSFRIVLINKTLWKIVFDGFMYIGDEDLPLSGSVDNENTTELGYLKKQSLNDYPEFDLTLWRWTTEGQDGKIVCQLKIRPKQFFKNQTYSPYLNADVHLYSLADDFAPPTKRENTLTNYTRDNLPDESTNTYDQMRVKLFDVEARASFPESIDLHIHQLTDDYEKMDAFTSLNLQIKHFEKYLSDAVIIGVPHIYIIHGKGKGRLQKEIHRRLKENPDVVRYEEGYHDGYGTGGATKVIL